MVAMVPKCISEETILRSCPHANGKAAMQLFMSLGVWSAKHLVAFLFPLPLS